MDRKIYAVAAISLALAVSALFGPGFAEAANSEATEHQITFSINGESITTPLNDAHVAVGFEDGDVKAWQR